MAVKIRLARFGKKKAPVYRIVAVDSHQSRDGKYIENLGTYEALTGTFVKFDTDRLQEWIAKGAQASDAVKKLQKKYAKGA